VERVTTNKYYQSKSKLNKLVLNCNPVLMLTWIVATQNCLKRALLLTAKHKSVIIVANLNYTFARNKSLILK
jgi:hypothetical protein